MMSAGQGGRIVDMSSIIASTGFNGARLWRDQGGADRLHQIAVARGRADGRHGERRRAGFIATELTALLKEEDRARIAARAALRRLADPADVANAVGFLMADNAHNITGTVLTVDAGATA